ncbi:hypothetical protein PFNF54_02406 [Plasmodium falciparum NF54]|uniref:Erythrocyte membrane protein 1 n=1 Tax=Plasmodium falciparum (isolate NF54) TaxID=5843 RepID=W7JV00_PLAFO|nr:hypothetical protein PFNF54_02406 [Plasmodium falciparum NF54]
MGNASSSEGEAKTPSLTESHNSARNILEGYAESIKEQASKDAKIHGHHLKGDLAKAVFRHPFSAYRPNYGNPCELDYRFHTNVWHRNAEDRNPCLFSRAKRFSNEGEAECNGGIITGNKGECGACAPYRRRHICDYNLHHINENNIRNTHDLLGNLLVMARSEGESIVKSHEYTGYGIYKSGICTSLARSFADIGDIIRGKDLYRRDSRTDKLEENLRKIFANIYKELKNGKKWAEAKEYYQDDGTGNYYKLREAWWALNRKDVWKALTCSAPRDAQYFIKSSVRDQTFSNDYCGHGEHEVLTNLDYVPQFLRWFEEWAEEFCRIKKIKLGKVKEACRDDSKKLYCSHNGYDCTKTIRNKDILSDNPKCTGCSVKCKVYELWLRNQRNEFEKQKKKYYKEIQTYTSKDAKTDSNINNEYYKEFYDKLKNEGYETLNKFIKLLNEGRYCKEKISGERNIDFTMTGDKDAFYRSDYCQICPECGVQCSGTTCTPKKVIHPNCKDKETYEPGDAKTTDITVLYSGDEEGDIAQKLQDFCNDKNKENDENYEKWQCYYKSSEINKCQMTPSSHKVPKHGYIMSFYAFFDLWVKNLLIDSINWKNDLTNCINNTNVTDCKNDCNTNCKCFENWAKTKENEWKKVKTIYKNENGNTNNYYKKLNNHFQGYFFHVMKELNKEEKWYKLMEDLKEKIDSSNLKNGTKDSEGAIKVLFDHLKDIAERCIDNNSKDSCPPSVDTKTNPCAKPPGSKPTKSVKQLAEHMQQKAQKLLGTRGGESKLKGDATRGTYNLGGQGNTLNGDICKITKNHTNDSRPNGEPCTGKDKVKNGFRLKIGTPWTNIVQKKKKKSYKDFYLPPRRQHMCTSNLENLSTSSKGLSNGSFASHSLLGDVLLAAKFEAQKIILVYKNKNNINIRKRITDPNDQATVCRAIRYSFADLGDIIRGKDMWNINSDAKDLQDRLEKIFKTINEKLPNEIQKRYTNRENKHLDLRSDWWEANRHQVWRAMKCATKGISNNNCNGIPIEDYIPQRLRWMTEWAEWYCKKQSQEYEKLEEKCGMCTGKGQGDGKDCTQKDKECSPCKKACDAYKKEIEKWEKQWKTVSAIYQILYAKARIVASNGGPGYYNTEVQKKDRSVYDFLYELHLQNGGKKGPPPATHPYKSVNTRDKRDATDDTTPTVYSTAAGYVHQEAHIGDCKEQHVFCDNNGNKEKYAFKNPPNVYVEACKCMTREAPPPPTTPSTPNPCAETGGVHTIKTVTDVAKILQGEANETMLKNSSNGNDKDESKLKGKAEEGDYSRGGTPSDFNNNLCGITQKHSNAHNDSQQPCYGKDQKRFNVGTEWSFKDNHRKRTHPEAYMPPRREHICTSNLEYLIHKRKKPIIEGDPNKIIHSLLGDVLLAAKYEAENIKKLYEENNNRKDQEGICRAMKYSFADIGDIIRGKDMWIENNDAKRLQTNLKEIFTKIKEKTGGTTYNEDNDPYLKLRADWWEANRAKVWKAMKCKTNGVDITCDSDHTPLDDYIPQRLRWMTEWAEWYCKAQSQEYKKLEEKCSQCKSKGKGGNECYRETKECNDCKQACEEYKRKIKTWADQWKVISNKYEDLYKKAQNPTNAVLKDNKDEKDKNVIDFLTQLQKANNGEKTGVHTVYSTAAGYIHQEARTRECQEQREFCDKKNGIDNTSYAFKDPPHGYATACDCINRSQTEEPKKKEENVESACKIVEEVLSKPRDKTTGGIDHCNPKYYPRKENYPGWNCTPGQFKSGHAGACMPPRRIKLCVINLQYLNEKKSPEELRKAFIQCAAIETYWLWQKYKKDKNGGVAQAKLNSGTIPDDFKRQMFYTFGDYRDLCLDTDISSKADTSTGVGKVKINIDSVFQKIDITNVEQRKPWWGKNAEAIWDGMLCALSYNTTNKNMDYNAHTKLNPTYGYNAIKSELEDFVNRPQFLRWFTEWSDEFCTERSIKIKELETKCNDCTVSESGTSDATGNKTCDDKDKCDECKRACTTYKTWLKNWKTQYKTQSKKYFDDKRKELYKSIDDVASSTQAYQYLHAQLKKLCGNADCKCMDGESKETTGQPDNSHDSHMPASLDDEPEEVNGKCNCKVKHRPQPPLALPPPAPSGPPAEDQIEHDNRGRSERGDQGPLPARPPPPPQAAQPPQPKPKRTGEGLGRNLPPADRNTNLSDSEEEDDEDDDEVQEEEETPPSEAEEGEGHVETEEETKPVKEKTEGAGATEVTKQGSAPTATTPTVEDICATVAKALKGDKSLNAACALKYGKNNSRLGWKCIPTSGDKTDTSENGAPRRARSAHGGKSDSEKGSICVPPRRRRLYIKKIVDWAESQSKTVTSVNGDGNGSQEVVSVNGASESGGSGSGTESQASDVSQGNGASTSPQVALLHAFVKSAAIETFFAWHKYKVDKEIEEKEKQAAQNHLVQRKTSENPQKKLEGGEIPEDFKRQMFYTLGDYRDILVGDKTMIEALEKSGDTKIEDISEKIPKILDGENNKAAGGGPKQPNSGKTPQEWWKENAKHIWHGMICALTYNTDSNGKDKKIQQVKATDNTDLFQKLKKDNDYETVSFGASGTGAKSNDDTKLKNFVVRPTYFRWLEEWGEEFCRKQKHKLYIIKKDCRDNKFCSGDGLRCDEKVPDKKDIFKHFDCPSCARHCRSYRKWIERKKTEYEKQESAYSKQKSNYVNGSNGDGGNNNDKEFYTKLETCTKATNFLESLKGQCIGNNNGGTDIKFSNTNITFGSAEDCKPCSEFKVNCENGSCGSAKQKDCPNNTITSQNIKGLTDQVDMRVSDNTESGFEGDLGICQGAGIFKGIRKDEWKCGDFCGIDICTLEKTNNGKESDKKYIIMKEFVKRWLEYFFEDYNRIQKKLKTCKENGKGSTCIRSCVDEWIKLKKDEWQKINSNYLDQNTKENPEGNNLSSFLEDGPFKNEVDKAIKPCGNLTDFKKSKKCNGTSRSGNSEESTKYDGVICLLDNLKNIIKTCQNVPSGKPDTPCQKSPAPVGDDDDPLEEENPVTQPNICPQTSVEEKKKEEEEKCDEKEEEEEKEEEKDKGDEEVKEEEKDKGDEEEEAEEEEEEEEETDSHIYEDYSDSDAEEDDEDEAVTESLSPSESQPKRLLREFPSPELKNAMLFSTILWMVGIGFAAFTYFFLKYEELDINDIYVPGSPKYKTLIEVVLEPSKSDGNTPGKGDGNTLGDDMVPTTNTFTDEEWNELKQDFVSQYIQSRLPMDVPQYDVSTESPMNIGGNVLDDGMDEKPFITSIHDRDLNSGEEISYNIHMSTNTNNDIPKYVSNNVYSGIDLINDTLSDNKHIDIYDEVLKRKENELFGTNYKKNTSNNSVAKNTNSDPIMNQLDLLHKWLDRHRDICENWGKKEDILNKLNEQWNKDNDGGDIPNDNKKLNTDVSIQIDMDETKGKKEFSNMDTILDDMEDDIYYDVNDENPSVDDIPMDHNKVDVPKKVHVEMKILNNTSNGSLEQQFPISDVWNI